MEKITDRQNSKLYNIYFTPSYILTVPKIGRCCGLIPPISLQPQNFKMSNKILLYWQTQNKKTLKRINQLIKDIEHNGCIHGIGNPELLKGNLQGEFSRRINEKSHPLAFFTSRSRNFKKQ